METVKKTVGINLQNLRKEKKLTQLEIAEMFGYSDKAVSKWENGDTLPDIETLYNLCKYYGVTLDYLVHEGDDSQKKKLRRNGTNKISISCLLVSLVWMIATILYVWIWMFPKISYWQVFLWAVPVSCIILFLLNHIWGKPIYFFYIGTVFIWSLISSFYCQFLAYQPWALFLLGIPAQIILLLWVGIKDSSIYKFRNK